MCAGRGAGCFLVCPPQSLRAPAVCGRIALPHPGSVPHWHSAKRGPGPGGRLCARSLLLVPFPGSSSPAVAPPPPRSLRPCLASGPQVGLHACRWRDPSWRRLSCPAARPGSRHGPLFLGVPIRLPGVMPCAPWGPGAPSAYASHPVCRLGPTHFGTLADPPELFCLAALPIAPSPPSHRSPLHVCRIAATGNPGP